MGRIAFRIVILLIGWKVFMVLDMRLTVSMSTLHEHHPRQEERPLCLSPLEAKRLMHHIMRNGHHGHKGQEDEKRS
jgi:hypothetical protein